MKGYECDRAGCVNFTRDAIQVKPLSTKPRGESSGLPVKVDQARPKHYCSWSCLLNDALHVVRNRIHLLGFERVRHERSDVARIQRPKGNVE